LSRRNEGSGSADDAAVFAAGGACGIVDDASDGGACDDDGDATVRDVRDDSGDGTVRGASAGRWSTPGDVGCETSRVAPASGSRIGSAGALARTDGGGVEVFATDAVVAACAACVVVVRRTEVA
jgi:hypothetical protein